MAEVQGRPDAPDSREILDALDQHWLTAATVDWADVVDLGLTGLGLGEAEAIVLAQRTADSSLIVDDWQRDVWLSDTVSTSLERSASSLLRGSRVLFAPSCLLWINSKQGDSG